MAENKMIAAQSHAQPKQQRSFLSNKYLIRARGFTLVEVLAALVIVSLGMLGVIEAVSQTANTGVYLREKTIAHWIAMNRLSEVRLEAEPPKVSKTSDDVEMAGRKWRWTMTVTQTQVESMRRIDVSVAPEEADDDVSLAYVTGFFGAAVAAGGTVTANWPTGESTTGGPGQPGGNPQNPGEGGVVPGGDSPPKDENNTQPQPLPNQGEE